jgi:hypothetical protein
MAAHRRWVARWLWCSIHYEVSFYGLGMTWGTHFTNLGQRSQAIPSGWWWRSSLRLARQWGTPLDNHQLQDLDRKPAGVHPSLLGWFNGSKWWQKLGWMAS